MAPFGIRRTDAVPVVTGTAEELPLLERSRGPKPNELPHWKDVMTDPFVSVAETANGRDKNFLLAWNSKTCYFDLDLTLNERVSGGRWITLGAPSPSDSVAQS